MALVTTYRDFRLCATWERERPARRKGKKATETVALPERKVVSKCKPL